MDADALATRMSVLTRALPARILLVDDDELEVELIADRLAAAGFDVTRAANGQEALAALERQWFPVVITDWQMPVMDGIAFTEAVRGRGIADTYIIMLTMREASVDYERGYIAGVDDYLSKKVPDAELFARINAAFNTLALRRSLRQVQAAQGESASIDPQSGAFATGELYNKLHGEICRAQRYGRQLAVVTVGIRASGGDEAQVLNPAFLRTLVQTLDAAVRAHIDWIGRLPVAQGAAFAVVLAEAGVSEAPIVKERLMRVLRRCTQDIAGVEINLSFGVAALERSSGGAGPLAAQDMLDVAEHCRHCSGCTSPEQLSAVQRSVTCQVAIACRHGYVLDSECTLKQSESADPAGDLPVLLAG